MEFGWVLYVLMAGLLLLIWQQAGALSLDTLFDRDSALHHQVHRVLKKHPKGGTWREYSAWMREES